MASKIPFVSPCFSSRCESEESSSHPEPRPPPVQPREPPHRFAVIDRILGLRVGEVEPLLQEVDPQHLLDSERLPSLARLRIVRLDQLKQPLPRNHRIHLSQKLLRLVTFPFSLQAIDANVPCLPITSPPHPQFHRFLCT